MSSQTATIAEAVKTAVAALPVASGAEVERTYWPHLDESKMGTKLFLTIVPKGEERELANRSEFDRDITVDIGIRKRLQNYAAGGKPNNAELDALMEIAEAIADGFGPRTNGTLAGSVKWIRTERNPLYVPQMIDQNGVFCAVVSVTYRITQ